jgi:hypothetical protein
VVTLRVGHVGASAERDGQPAGSWGQHLGADPALAHDLGGKGWSWMTGWFNIVGLVGIVASVGYGAATFLNATLGLYGLDILGVNFGDDQHILSETWLLFS